ncbi:uncharacterized protein BDR25DRAFT_350608 [Lindgomyces ingoldianus]|uniref:Uncharacterized protein n=1 Tax=Lindgomyces ingoldianus TaxID=673940 RepID=A0ACB6R9R7_9PLEO|nr:uncharacterized protein BDR25DRAFT_350608 [Lindgomyces ingoldianus]KAF2475206.1 hypothetical protein BDR25DRAFT_350608 [Lindgomyces ingoldianus]
MYYSLQFRSFYWSTYHARRIAVLLTCFVKFLTYGENNDLERSRIYKQADAHTNTTIACVTAQLPNAIYYLQVCRLPHQLNNLLGHPPCIHPITCAVDFFFPSHVWIARHINQKKLFPFQDITTFMDNSKPNLVIIRTLERKIYLLFQSQTSSSSLECHFQLPFWGIPRCVGSNSIPVPTDIFPGSWSGEAEQLVRNLVEKPEDKPNSLPAKQLSNPVRTIIKRDGNVFKAAKLWGEFLTITIPRGHREGPVSIYANGLMGIWVDMIITLVT